MLYIIHKDYCHYLFNFRAITTYQIIDADRASCSINTVALSPVYKKENSFPRQLNIIIINYASLSCYNITLFIVYEILAIVYYIINVLYFTLYSS